MAGNFIVFERNFAGDFDTPDVDDWRLDIRHERQALPVGSTPVAMVKEGQILAWSGQEFDLVTVTEYAEYMGELSHFRPAGMTDPLHNWLYKQAQ